MEHIAIIGFGSQAKSWALNLRDSGLKISIVLRENSKSEALVKKMNFNYQILNKACRATNIALLIPDNEHLDFFNKYSMLFKDRSRFIYAHGYSVSYNNISALYPQFQHIMLAPKAIASELRFEYETNGKLAAAYATLNQNAEDTKYLLYLAKNLGINVGPFKTSFMEETNCDLFSEQSILCSLIPYGILNAYNILIENGYNSEIAFIECWHETKLIANALINLGPSDFFKLISPNALVGGYFASKELFDKEYKTKLQSLLNNIENGNFNKIVKITDFTILRNKILKEWESEDLNQKFKAFKNEYKLYK